MYRSGETLALIVGWNDTFCLSRRKGPHNGWVVERSRRQRSLRGRLVATQTVDGAFAASGNLTDLWGINQHKRSSL